MCDPVDFWRKLHCCLIKKELHAAILVLAAYFEGRKYSSHYGRSGFSRELEEAVRAAWGYDAKDLPATPAEGGTEDRSDGSIICATTLSLKTRQGEIGLNDPRGDPFTRNSPARSFPGTTRPHLPPCRSFNRTQHAWPCRNVTRFLKVASRIFFACSERTSQKPYKRCDAPRSLPLRSDGPPLQGVAFQAHPLQSGIEGEPRVSRSRVLFLER